MSELSKAIASRESEIGRLQREIEAIRAVESILAPSARAKKAAAPKTKAKRKRRKMTAAEKKAVSLRMKESWAKRKKAAKKAGK